MRTNEGIRVQEAPSCLLCDKDGVFLYQSLQDRLFGAAGVWSLMRCPECGLVWLDPRPIPTEIRKFYAHYFTHDGVGYPSRLKGLRRPIQNAILASCLGYNTLVDGRLQKAIGRILGWIGPIREVIDMSVMTLKWLRNGGRLLDVGCGNGQFLAKMRALGWEVVGVEPDRKAAKVARERFGLSVHEGALEEVGFPDNGFDAITVNHVIEHVWNPLGALREYCRILKPGGNLVVVTPNIESLGHRLFGRAWRGLEVPRHLYLFSPDPLGILAEAAGLRIKDLRTISKKASSIWHASRLIWRDGSLPGRYPKDLSWHLRVEGLVFWALEYLLVRVRPWGEEILMIATKESSE